MMGHEPCYVCLLVQHVRTSVANRSAHLYLCRSVSQNSADVIARLADTRHDSVGVDHAPTGRLLRDDAGYGFGGQKIVLRSLDIHKTGQ